MITATIMAHKIKIVQNGNGRCYTSGRWSEASEIMEYSPRSLKYAIYNFSGNILHKTYRPSGQSSNATLPLDGLMGKRNRSGKVTFGQNFSTKDFLKRKFEKKRKFAWIWCRKDAYIEKLWNYKYEFKKLNFVFNKGMINVTVLSLIRHAVAKSSSQSTVSRQC